MRGGLRAYYYFLSGAFGGLTGWFLAALLPPETVTDSVANNMLNGALLGAPVCAAVSAYNGFSTRSLARLVKFTTLGLVLGAVAGGVALSIAQVTYSSLLPKLLPRGNVAAAAIIAAGTANWIFFGGLIGFAVGVGKGVQFYKGLLGGGLGGLTGGLICEIMRMYSSTGADYRVFQASLALSLSLMGGFIGLSVSLINITVQSAWIEVLTGKLNGRIYDVTKYVNRGGEAPGIIGSDERRANIYLTADQEVLPLHARIGYANGVPTLTVINGEEKIGVTLVNGKRATIEQLNDGDRIQVGSAMLIYRNKYK